MEGQIYPRTLRDKCNCNLTRVSRARNVPLLLRQINFNRGLTYFLSLFFPSEREKERRAEEGVLRTKELIYRGKDG